MFYRELRLVTDGRNGLRKRGMAAVFAASQGVDMLQPNT